MFSYKIFSRRSVITKAILNVNPKGLSVSLHHLCVSKLVNKSSIYQKNVTFLRYFKNMGDNTFRGVQDRFNGITVNSAEEPCPSQDVNTKIQESLSRWKEEQKRCIWFKVNIKDASWVPLLANEGFNFHHARDDFVMMYKWLPPNSSPNLPPASHTNLGVGGMVFNEHNQILAVSEKHYDYPHWKLPGGYVERGEDIVDAAVREVKEETGVDAFFESVVEFRHTHKMMFDNSDIYIVVMLKSTSDVIIKCNREISQCQWMDLDEYLNHPNVHEFNRMVVRKALDYKKRGIKLDMQKKTLKWATFSREMTLMGIEDL